MSGNRPLRKKISKGLALGYRGPGMHTIAECLCLGWFFPQPATQVSPFGAMKTPCFLDDVEDFTGAPKDATGRPGYGTERDEEEDS